MIIEPFAFSNCVSLKEIVFKNNSVPTCTNIYKCNTSKDYQIIVPDSLYDAFYKIEMPHNTIKHLIKKSDKIQQTIDNIKNSNIIQTIILLEKCIILYDVFSNTFKTIIKQLKDKYQISDDKIQHIKNLQQRKQQYVEQS